MKNVYFGFPHLTTWGHYHHLYSGALAQKSPLPTLPSVTETPHRFSTGQTPQTSKHHQYLGRLWEPTPRPLHVGLRSEQTLSRFHLQLWITLRTHCSWGIGTVNTRQRNVMPFNSANFSLAELNKLKEI